MTSCSPHSSSVVLGSSFSYVLGGILCPPEPEKPFGSAMRRAPGMRNERPRRQASHWPHSPGGLGWASLPPEEWTKGIGLDSFQGPFHLQAAPLNLPLLLLLPSRTATGGYLLSTCRAPHPYKSHKVCRGRDSDFPGSHLYLASAPGQKHHGKPTAPPLCPGSPQTPLARNSRIEVPKANVCALLLSHVSSLLC